MTRIELETALDAGKLEARNMSAAGKWYRIRRNGRTQTWKTRPDDFRIPCKVGFRECFNIVPNGTIEYRVAS